MKKEIYRNILDGNTRPCCFYCEEDHPAALDGYHHYEGKLYPDDEILTCKNCHAKITSDQNNLPTKSRATHDEAYYLVTIGAHLETIGKNLKECGFVRAENDRGY